MGGINLKEYLTRVRKLESDIYIMNTFVDKANQIISEETSSIKKTTEDLEDCRDKGTISDYKNCKYIMDNYCNGEEYSVWISGSTIEKTLEEKYNITVPKQRITINKLIKSLIISIIIAGGIIFVFHKIWLGILLGLLCFTFGYCASTSNLGNTIRLASEHAISVLEKEVTSSNNYINELKNIIQSSKKAIEIASNNLNELYNQSIIFPKYRNFIAINQVSEYIDSGRCTELEGPNGAYNLFESELRQNIIIDKLETVIDELEQIKQGQFYIYQALKATQNAISNMNISVVTNTYIDGVRY